MADMIVYYAFIFIHLEKKKLIHLRPNIW